MEINWKQKYVECICGKKGRWVVVITWILIAAILNFTFPQANSQKYELAPNLDKNQPSQVAKRIVEKEFPTNSGTPTGPAGNISDATALFSHGNMSILIGTIGIVLVLLLLFYRSPIMAIIPLVGIGIAYEVISPILGAIGKAGSINLDSQSHLIMTVLLLGAETDYCLFLISRFRSNLKLEKDKTEAMKKALMGTSGAIAMSGLTVVFSLLMLLISQYGPIHRLAIPFSLSILIMMFTSLTLIPALLTIIGRASFFPLVPRTREMQRERATKKGKPFSLHKKSDGFGMRLGTYVVKNPKKLVVLSLLFLGIFAFLSTKIIYTFEQYDTVQVINGDRSKIIPIVLVIIAVLLLFYLRSITATVFLIVTVILSYFSALGIGWGILHYLFGVEAIQGFIPLYAFVFIVALGEDYNLFMISSIWKKSRRLPLYQAVKEGIAESGAVITSAGLILAGTFAVLTTLPIQLLVHFGTIMAIGVFLDTFIVRLLLVPAIIVILRRWAFWPVKRGAIIVENPQDLD